MSRTFEDSLLNVLKDDLDEDKQFALSLVCTLKTMTEREKWQAKNEILQLFQYIKANRPPAPTCQSFQQTAQDQIHDHTHSHRHSITMASQHTAIKKQLNILSSHHIQRPSPNSIDTLQTYLSNFTPSPQSPTLDL